jgi:two-component system sensor histidine kinase BaeS
VMSMRSVMAYLGHSPASLRAKLMFSYLVVALGAILLLSFAVSLAFRNFVYQSNIEILRRQVDNRVAQIEYFYQLNGATWDRFPQEYIATGDPLLLVLIDQNGQQLLCGQPAFLTRGNCNDPTVRNALQQSLKGNEDDGSISVSTADHTFSSLFVCEPIKYNGQIVGALFLSAPLNSDAIVPVLDQINQAVLLTGLVVALLVVVFSFFFARGLTHPLESLTAAAEQMKQGKYTQRVTPPGSHDELGRLARTFNDMADTIEADISELRRQDQVRRELIANIAHDLATPLTAIQGFSEALADDIITGPTARQETAQRIGREVQRLRRLVADMQNMTALESGHAPLDLAPLDLSSLVAETLVVIEPECEQANIQLCNDVPPDAPLVLADSDRITQVLLNLLDNARRHTPSHGRIRISAVPKEEVLVVMVSDTGVGIDPADLPHIFERFYRADRSRTGATGGSGLGLSIVKAIITAHGGRIWAESTPNQGTTISFTLPLAKDESGK